MASTFFRKSSTRRQEHPDEDDVRVEGQLAAASPFLGLGQHVGHEREEEGQGRVEEDADGGGDEDAAAGDAADEAEDEEEAAEDEHHG